MEIEEAGARRHHPAAMAIEEAALDDIIRRPLNAKNGRTVKQVMLTEAEIKQLCKAAQEILVAQPNLLELEAPIKICGTFVSKVTWSTSLKEKYLSSPGQIGTLWSFSQRTDSSSFRCRITSHSTTPPLPRRSIIGSTSAWTASSSPDFPLRVSQWKTSPPSRFTRLTIAIGRCFSCLWEAISQKSYQRPMPSSHSTTDRLPRLFLILNRIHGVVWQSPLQTKSRCYQ